jgi:dihydropyrimidinase
MPIFQLRKLPTPAESTPEHFMQKSTASMPTRRTAIAKLTTASAVAAFAVCGLSGCAAKRRPERQPSELVIARGRVVTATSDLVTDIRIVDGKVVELGQKLSATRESSRTISAQGKLVLPGGIDPHVHLAKPWADDFRTGSMAALAGGITSVGHMCFPTGDESPVDAVKRERKLVQENGMVDAFLHAVISSPDSAEPELIAALENLGTASVKFFMENERFVAGLTSVQDLLRTASRAGMISMIHAEDMNAIRAATKKLADANQVSTRYFAESRPVQAEIIAVERAIKLCQETGAAIYFVHLSSEVALQKCQDARKLGMPVFVETRPVYLHLDESVYEGDQSGLYVCMPPIRSKSDQSALWKGLANESIQTIASDHASWRKPAKLDPSMTIKNPLGGVNNLQVMLPMLMDAGVRQNRISLKRFVELTSTNAAKLFGLYPTKGEIAIGSDGDVVVWDEKETRTIDGRQGFSNAGFSVYDGTEVTGWPTVTIRRGVVAFEHGEVAALTGTARVLEQARETRQTNEL